MPRRGDRRLSLRLLRKPSSGFGGVMPFTDTDQPFALLLGCRRQRRLLRHFRCEAVGLWIPFHYRMVVRTGYALLCSFFMGRDV